jgi:phospholipid/cholesterol/gamma-HCH transport system substrate-binding protein
VKRAIKYHLKDFIAVVALFVVAGAVSFYILQNQRMRFPVLDPKPFVLQGEFATGQAVTPGQGQTVRLAGVRLGDIAKVELRDGKALITMELEQKYEGLVKTSWQGLLRPRTGLKDMFIEMIPRPGGEPAPENWVMPVSNTLPDVNPDEFLSALDDDTRDYLKLLLNGAARGLDGRADDLTETLERFEPTHRHLAAVQTEVAKRREDLRNLIHALNELNDELGDKDDDLAELVATSSRVFDAFAQERVNVAATIRELPSTLETATDALQRVERMAEVLGPSSVRLIPVARALRRANEATRPFALEAEPLIRRDIRPFVREFRPLVRDLRPATGDLVDAEPELKRTIHVLNRLFNMLAFNPNGREGPEVEGREEGYLFWFAWLAHQSVSIFHGQDANGVFRPLVLGGTCNTLQNTVASSPQLAFIFGLTGVLYDANICGGVLSDQN